MILIVVILVPARRIRGLRNRGGAVGVFPLLPNTLAFFLGFRLCLNLLVEYPDAAVGEVYSLQGRKAKREIVACGDLEAVVGDALLGDGRCVTGGLGVGQRNSRG